MNGYDLVKISTKYSTKSWFTTHLHSCRSESREKKKSTASNNFVNISLGQEETIYVPGMVILQFWPLTEGPTVKSSVTPPGVVPDASDIVNITRWCSGRESWVEKDPAPFLKADEGMEKFRTDWPGYGSGKYISPVVCATPDVLTGMINNRNGGWPPAKKDLVSIHLRRGTQDNAPCQVTVKSSHCVGFEFLNVSASPAFTYAYRTACVRKSRRAREKPHMSVLRSRGR